MDAQTGFSGGEESEMREDSERLCESFCDKYNINLFVNFCDCDLFVRGSNSRHVLLSLFNLHQHWTSLSVFPRENSMVFLDSLYGGSEGETFFRCCNFLTCATEEVIGWSEWHFLIIPEDHLPQQLNFHDCGMFSIKWAEHVHLVSQWTFSRIIWKISGTPQY